MYKRIALAASVVATIGVNTALAQGIAPGGFLESATGNAVRARLSAGQIQNFVPSRGRFTFPSPYGTTGVRLTNSSDCGGNDCVNYIGYSYWNNINNHVGSDTMYIFAGLFRSRGGQGPSLFSYNKNTGETKNLGPLFSGANDGWTWESGEGWYFSASRRTSLYINQSGGSKMMRYDVLSHAMEQVFDSSDIRANTYLWQMHSSNDDRVHSATIRDSSSYEMLGCVAYREDQHKAYFFAKQGDYDECQIDKSGRWLVIKENDDNRIVDVQSGAETIIRNKDGAAGHSDVGYGYIVGEDDQYPQAGATRVWRFGESMSASGQGRLVYELTAWGSMGLGHVAHSNASSGTALEKQMACVSNASRENNARENEIVCFRLDTSLQALIVAPNMTDLNASGGDHGGGDYEKRPKGNLDVTGEYFIWTTNMGGGRLDAFIVRVPKQKLIDGAGSPPPPSDPPPANPPSDPTPPWEPPPGWTCPCPPKTAPGESTPQPPPNDPPPAPPGSSQGVSWMSLINVTANGNNVRKTGGCDGCPDASAVSNQQVGGNGALTFAASETGKLRFVSLSSGGAGTTPGDLRYAIRLQGTSAEVRESGAYKSETSFSSGDTFRIVVENGVVKYLKNGAVFYTSGSNTGGQAMRVHVVLFDMNATVNGITVGG